MVKSFNEKKFIIFIVSQKTLFIFKRKDKMFFLMFGFQEFGQE